MVEASSSNKEGTRGEEESRDKTEAREEVILVESSGEEATRVLLPTGDTEVFIEDLAS